MKCKLWYVTYLKGINYTFMEDRCSEVFAKMVIFMTEIHNTEYFI